MAAKFQYKFTGDGPKVFRGKLIRPGDPIEAEEELIHGDFEPANSAAKAAKAETDKANAEAPKIAEAERLAAMNGSLQFPELAAPGAAPASSSPAPAAPAEG